MADGNQAPQVRRFVPSTDTEFAVTVTRPTWADPGLAPELNSRLIRDVFLVDEDGHYLLDDKGQPVKVSHHQLQILQMFTQDVRLGNLTNEELLVVREHFDLAHDLIHSGYPESGAVVMERSIDIIETSHSRFGWFRELLATLKTRAEQTFTEEKQSFFTGRKKEPRY